MVNGHDRSVPPSKKNFSKTIKEPGLKGALKSFVHPQREIFEAVKDLSFEVPKGQILGFIGANGAGKSTTIKMLTGILKPTSGYCRINGRFRKIIVKIMSKILALFLGNGPNCGGIWPCRKPMLC